MYDEATSGAPSDATPSADVWRRTAAGLARTVSIERSWSSWGGVHSGHLGALALEAMGAMVGDLRPVRGLSVSYLCPVDDRPLTLNTMVERVGTTSSVTSLRADQDGTLALIGMATFGAAGPGPRYPGIEMPRVPTAAKCPVLPHSPLPFSQHLEIRAASEDRCLGGGKEAELVSWVRFVDGRAIDAAGITTLLDGLAPGIFATITVPVAMPMLQLSVEFAADLLSESLDHWILIRTRTEHSAGGWVNDESTAWSEDGRLLARSRHCRRLLPRRD